MGMAPWIKSLLYKAGNLSSDLQTHEKPDEAAQACAVPVHTCRKMGGRDPRVRRTRERASQPGTCIGEQQETLCQLAGSRGPTLEVVLCPSMWRDDGDEVWGFPLHTGPVYPVKSHTAGGEGADSGGCPFTVAPALLPAV